MHNLSLAQALNVWTELESCYYNDNSFGRDTAELYIYRLMPYNSIIARSKPDVSEQSGLIGDLAREALDQANQSLYSLLQHFSKLRKVQIKVEGQELGEWLQEARFAHRVQVQVLRE